MSHAEELCSLILSSPRHYDDLSAKIKDYLGSANFEATSLYRGAIYVGSGVAKGAGWLWSSGKSGVESFKNRGGKE